MLLYVNTTFKYHLLSTFSIFYLIISHTLLLIYFCHCYLLHYVYFFCSCVCVLVCEPVLLDSYFLEMHFLFNHILHVKFLIIVSSQPDISAIPVNMLLWWCDF